MKFRMGSIARHHRRPVTRPVVFYIDVRTLHRKLMIPLATIATALVAGCGGAGAVPGSAAPQAAQTAGTVTSSTSVPSYTTKQWANVKFGGGGYVPGLIFHPTSANVLYARTDIGGAYRWNATTAAWVPITDGFGPTEEFYHGSESMALDPNDDRRVYMSTGISDTDDRTGRLYISTDRGDTWSHVDLPFRVGSNNQGRAIGERMMVDPNLPNVLYYGSRSAGLWRSSDHGQTWAQVQSLSPYQMPLDQVRALPNGGAAIGVEQVVFDTSTKGSGSATQAIYVAIAPDYAAAAGLASSLYKSSDGGATWSSVPVPLTGYHIPHMVRSSDGKLYVAFTKEMGPGPGGPAALYRFDGSNWTLLYQPSYTGFGIGGLSVYGTGSATRIVLGISNSWGNYEGQSVVTLSDDAGTTWREIAATAPHTPDTGFSGWVDDVEIDPSDRDHVLHVTGGGVWETKNASAAKPSWNFVSAGMEETATLALMTPPAGASYRLLNSSGDIGMIVQTELSRTATRGPSGMFANGLGADMAWSTPSYIAAIGNTAWDGRNILGAYSSDSGVTWTAFPTVHPDALANRGDEASIAVTRPGNVVWAPKNSIPAYTVDNGATWTYTNLPALAPGYARAYRVVADRKNPDKVYAYNSGGAWWAQWSETPRFFVSNDGGHTFTERTSFIAAGPTVASFQSSSIAVNPNAEGDIWIVDGQRIFHSLDAGATWTRLNVTASIFGSSQFYPDVYGASSIALGKAPAGASYSASVYIVGVVGGVWGVYRSDDAGATWRRFNDDKHQFAGISQLAADQGIEGRLFISGSGRGVLFSY